MVAAPGHLWRAVDGEHHRWATYGFPAVEEVGSVGPSLCSRFMRAVRGLIAPGRFFAIVCRQVAEQHRHVGERGECQEFACAS
jgi:hypothetical protein